MTANKQQNEDDQESHLLEVPENNAMLSVNCVEEHEMEKIMTDEGFRTKIRQSIRIRKNQIELEKKQSQRRSSQMMASPNDQK